MSIRILVPILCLSMASCLKDPTTCVTANKSKIGIGEEVVLDASCSEDADVYKWFLPEEATIVSGDPGCEEKLILKFDTIGTFTTKILTKDYRGKKGCGDSGTNRSGSEESISITVE